MTEDNTKSYLRNIIERAEKGDQACKDWLGHLDAKMGLRALADIIKNEPEVDGPTPDELDRLIG